MINNGVMTIEFINESGKACKIALNIEKFFPVSKRKGKTLWPIIREHADRDDLRVLEGVLERKLADAQAAGKKLLINQSQNNLWLVQDILGEL